MTHRGELPQPRTSFVGRSAELDSAAHLLAENRLLTLTGPGGCGKTRLAIALAHRIPDDFPAGVYFVSLAPVTDPSLVPVSIAQAVGLQDARVGSLLEHLTDHLKDRDLLLVLDNFEQVLSAGEFVEKLLVDAPGIRIIVTSRAPLHLSGEQEFPVPPLPVPERGTGSTLSPTTVAAFESSQLFAVRASSSTPGFAVTAENADAIAAIVQRVGGLPLAIELAAARVKLLPPQAILARLDDSLNLLVSTHVDVPDRHRTLRATIGWSHELLTEGAQRLLAASSVFRGGVALDAAEFVCADALDLDVPVLDALHELVDHSLLRLATPATAGPRYLVLETVREFAAERLGAVPEARAVRGAHAAYFQRLASTLASPPCWPGKEGLDVLEIEHDNFRAALDWYAREDAATGLRLASHLAAFWSARGHFSEGRRRLRELLELCPDENEDRVMALNGAAWLAGDQGDSDAARDLLAQSIALAADRHDVRGEGYGRLYRGRTTMASGHGADQAASDLTAALDLLAGADDPAGAAAALMLSALAREYGGEEDLACQLLERCVELCQALDLPSVGARAWQLLGNARLELDDLQGARTALERGVPAIVHMGDRFAMTIGLSSLAGLAAKSGKPELALKLAGAAAAHEVLNQVRCPAPLRRSLDEWLEPARSALGPAAGKVFEQGRSLTPDDALALALTEASVTPRAVGQLAGLTRRESEVAVLVAGGLTNREIASELFLSVRTVEVHVDRALSKLGFRTRTRLAAWVYEEGMLPRDT